MLYLSEKKFVYRFYKILEVNGESIGAPSVKEIVIRGLLYFRARCLRTGVYMEGLYLSKWGEKHIFLYTVGTHGP
jgi:hypothetical protein